MYIRIILFAHEYKFMLTLIFCACAACTCVLLSVSALYLACHLTAPAPYVAIFDSPDEPENIIAATLVFIGAWTTTAYEGNTSIWSKRLTLEEPLIGFRFRFTPLAFKKGIAMKIQMNGSPVSSIGE